MVKFLKIIFIVQQILNTLQEKSKCDLVIDEAVCIDNNQKILTADAQPYGLIAYYSFDDQFLLDSSGKQNHVQNVEIQGGMSIGGHGSSIYFKESDFMSIPHTKEYEIKRFSYTFFIYPIKSEQGNKQILLLYQQIEDEQRIGLKWCPILQKGTDDELNDIYFRSPAIFLDRQTGGIKVQLTTTDLKNQPKGEALFSNAKLQFNRWSHIAIVRKDLQIKLYINGILDAINNTVGYTQYNDMPLYLGNTPWHQNDCNQMIMMDNLRVYNIDLKDNWIEAEASITLGGIEPSFVYLGCLKCSLKLAVQSCIEGYHLCTKIELYSSGLYVSRLQGYINSNNDKNKIWNHGDQLIAEQEGTLYEEEEQTINTRLGLCCKNFQSK